VLQPREPGRDDQRDSTTSTGCRRACSRCGFRPRLTTARPSTTARGVVPALPRLLGRQPATLDPAVPPADSAPLLRRDDGRRRQDHRARQSSCTTKASTLLAQEDSPQQLVYAEPKNQAAKEPASPTCSSSWAYQTGETRACRKQLSWPAPTSCAAAIPAGASPNSSGPDIIRAMVHRAVPPNFLGIRMDSRKAEGMRFHHQPDHAGQRRRST